MTLTLEQAKAKADEFLSTILGPEDQRQPAKSDELAQMLMEAAGGNGKARPAAPRKLSRVLPRGKKK